jgi:dipeptidase D
VLDAICHTGDCDIAAIHIGEANASIASSGEIVVCTSSDEASMKELETTTNQWLHEQYSSTDPGMHCSITPCEQQETVIDHQAFEALIECLQKTPQGVIKMSETMKDTVETSNNIGRIQSEENCIFVSTHTRSFIDSDMEKLSHEIANVFSHVGAESETVMSAPAWQEDQQSEFLQLTSDTFLDVLGWRPRMVAMHFVLEAGFFVKKYPGIQIASIGPRIVEPHSTSERLELNTVDDIWQVLQELLRRLSV